jgi:hypothetical protein
MRSVRGKPLSPGTAATLRVRGGRRTTPEEELKLLVRSKRWCSRGATVREAVEDSTPTHCRKELGGTRT